MIERRCVSTSVRSVGSKREITGHAATFQTLSSNLGGFREQIAHGCFARSIGRKDDVKMLINHDPSLLLGRVRNSTLEVSEDHIGLRFRCLLPQTSYADDLLTSIDRRDIDECSFGFVCDDDDWDEGFDPETGERTAIRTLRSVTLLDTSVVTYPAYPDGTSVDALRSFQFPDGLPASMPVEVRSKILAAGPITTHTARSRRLHQFILS